MALEMYPVVPEELDAKAAESKKQLMHGFSSKHITVLKSKTQSENCCSLRQKEPYRGHPLSGGKSIPGHPSSTSPGHTAAMSRASPPSDLEELSSPLKANILVQPLIKPLRSLKFKSDQSASPRKAHAQDQALKDVVKALARLIGTCTELLIRKSLSHCSHIVFCPVL